MNAVAMLCREPLTHPKDASYARVPVMSTVCKWGAWTMVKPYPAELVRHLNLRDGTRVVLRPIRPEDRQIEKAFVQQLSDGRPCSRHLILPPLM